MMQVCPSQQSDLFSLEEDNKKLVSKIELLEKKIRAKD